jgi:hypothetical protein
MTTASVSSFVILLRFLIPISFSFSHSHLDHTTERSGFWGQVEHTAKDGRYDNECDETSLNKEVDDRIYRSAYSPKLQTETYT